MKAYENTIELYDVGYAIDRGDERVELHTTFSDSEESIAVCVNGRITSIKRGETVNVTRSVLDALKISCDENKRAIEIQRKLQK